MIQVENNFTLILVNRCVAVPENLCASNNGAKTRVFKRVKLNFGI